MTRRVVKCVHVCACGAVLICRAEPDKCAVGNHWQCLSCDLDQFDQEMDRKQAAELRKESDYCADHR